MAGHRSHFAGRLRRPLRALSSPGGPGRRRGRCGPPALPVRLFAWLTRRILARATDVIVLDRFMAQHVNHKRDVSEKLSILPPWPLDDYLEPVPHERNPFRTEHGLEGKRVV